MTALSPQESAALSLAFARERLGPASERALADPAIQALIGARLRRGVALEDAALRELYAIAPARKEVANEFLAYFLADLLRVAHPLISTRLRRFLDSWDLAQSVLGDAGPDIWELEFETRAAFVSLLAKRLAWKAAGRARGEAKRANDVELGESMDLAASARSSASVLSKAEEHDRLILVLLRLSERDRQILKIYLGGGSVSAIMDATGLGYEAARKALQRALRRARQSIAHAASEG